MNHLSIAGADEPEGLLFAVPETLSPRLAWIAKHGILTHHAPHMPESPWCAWLPANSKNGLPMDPEACGYGATEADAITDLAVNRRIPLWNEDGRGA